jgi:isopenicillin N synthase-like dioxygenase
MADAVPVIDLTPWFDGSEGGRELVARQVDAALQSVGFLLITGHQVAPSLRADVRVAGREFFGLPAEVKQRYAVTVGGRGWLPAGVEANGYAEGTETPPDLKESYAVGADQPSGNAEIDDYWFQPNVWPDEAALAEPITAYLAQMRLLADELLVTCAAAAGVAPDFFTRYTDHSTYTLNVNWYPPVAVVGEPEAGQFRIGPHTDFGTVTILDREPGKGGLQVWTEDGGWRDAPYHPDAFTINTAICSLGGPVIGGSPTATASCPHNRTHRMRTWSHWSTSTRPTTTRSSSRSSHPSAGPTTMHR